MSCSWLTDHITGITQYFRFNIFYLKYTILHQRWIVCEIIDKENLLSVGSFSIQAAYFWAAWRRIMDLRLSSHAIIVATVIFTAFTLTNTITFNVYVVLTIATMVMTSIEGDAATKMVRKHLKTVFFLSLLMVDDSAELNREYKLMALSIKKDDTFRSAHSNIQKMTTNVKIKFVVWLNFWSAIKHSWDKFAFLRILQFLILFV